MSIIRFVLAAAVLTLTVVFGSVPAHMRPQLLFGNERAHSSSLAIPLDPVPNPSPNPPVAVNDSYTVHGTAVLNSPGIMANDYDPDGRAINVAGIQQQPAHGTLRYISQNIYAYDAAAGYLGADSFTYSLCDSLLCSSGTVNITNVNQAPTANTDSYTVHASLLLKPIQNDGDPDGDSVFFDSIATQPQHGTLTYVRVGEYTYAPAYAYVGSDSFTYRIRDNFYLYSIGTVNIVVANQAPAANSDSYTVHASLDLIPMQNDTDPDGDSLSFIGIATQPSHGVLYNTYTSGKYTYVPTYAYVGSDSFTYTIKDSLGAVATGTVYINDVNQTPAANPDFYTVHASLELRPMLNDTDADGDSFSFNSIATQPSHGVLNYNGYGRYIYNPTYGYVGSYSFTYTIKDVLGAVATGTVYIDNVNQTPIANTDFYVMHAPLELIPMQNDSDPDADSFSFVGIASQPSHGSLAYNGYGKYIYSANSGYTGFDSFTYTIRDSLGASATGWVFVLTLSQAPVAAAVPYACSCPFDGGGTGSHNKGGSDDDPVNLATGRESYTPVPD